MPHSCTANRDVGLRQSLLSASLSLGGPDAELLTAARSSRGRQMGRSRMGLRWRWVGAAEMMDQLSADNKTGAGNMETLSAPAQTSTAVV